MPRNRDGDGSHKGFAFVQYFSVDEVEAVLEEKQVSSACNLVSHPLLLFLLLPLTLLSSLLELSHRARAQCRARE